MKPEVLDELRRLTGLKFCKMTGTGNDFILLDNRSAGMAPHLMSPLAYALCNRQRSVGADGLIVLEPSEEQDAKGPIDFLWHFFNADGSSAEMCGNGGRCAARFAFDAGLAGPTMLFATLAGPTGAQVEGKTVKLELVKPTQSYHNLRLAIDDQELIINGINCGVPHAVIRVDDVDNIPVAEWGRQLRFHSHFAPAGTNVNFVQFKDNMLWVRTYERGVEGETLACGTGSVACALMYDPANPLPSPVTIRVRSGECLRVYFNALADGFDQVFLEGTADYVYQGKLHVNAFAWLAHETA